MVRLTAAQRAVLVDKGPDFANLVFGGLVLGQFLSARALSIPLLITGLAAWGVVLGAVLLIAGDE